LRSTFIYTAVAAAYLVFVLGYLHVQGVDVTKLFQKPDAVSNNSYQLVLDNTVAQNADVAGSWAFNMPRG
jgi:hypothetical protein